MGHGEDTSQRASPCVPGQLPPPAKLLGSSFQNTARTSEFEVAVGILLRLRFM